MDNQARHLRGIDVTLRTMALGGLFLLAIWVLRDILLLVFAADFSFTTRTAQTARRILLGKGSNDVVWRILVPLRVGSTSFPF